MVEKERRTAPVSETNIRILRETTLAELGVDTSYDNLSLAADRFTLGVKKVGEETVFVGVLKHPCAGGHFAQFLNNISPFGDQNIGGIVDDVELPIRARRDYANGKNTETSSFIRLHERHLQDPRVGPPYIRFTEDHVDAWLKAIKINTGLRVFERLQRIRFINSIEDLRRELFSEDGSIINYLSDLSALFNMRSKWLMLQNDRFNVLYEDLFGRVGPKEAVEAVLKGLTKEEQGEFAVSYFVGRKRKILVDLGTHRIRSDKSNPYDTIGKVKVKFDGNGRDVAVSNNTGGSKVVISPTGQNSEKFSWRVIEYQFSKNYTKFSLYPVIAWRKGENGKREFLTQKEAVPLVRELGLPEGEKGDTKLGEIAVAYFARDIIKGWEPKMTLKPLGGARNRMVEQPMGGAQMPAWVAVEKHKKQLLKSETSVLARSEQHLASVQQ